MLQLGEALVTNFSGGNGIFDGTDYGSVNLLSQSRHKKNEIID